MKPLGGEVDRVKDGLDREGVAIDLVRQRRDRRVDPLTSKRWLFRCGGRRRPNLSTRIVAASKTWRRLKGTNQLPKVIAGIRFHDPHRGRPHAGKLRRLIAASP